MNRKTASLMIRLITSMALALSLTAFAPAVFAPVALLAADANANADAESNALQPGDVIVQIDFDDGGTDGFMIYTNGGDCAISNVDGALAVDIAKCGSLDYANQVYWDGFALLQGCEYTYSFDISSDMDRQVEYRLQLNGGDYHAYRADRIQVGAEVTHVEADWTMTEDSDPAPRLVFNMGFMDDMSGDPGPHRVLIDNISLTVKNADNAVAVESAPELPQVAVSQIGYLPSESYPKDVIVREDSEGGTFSIIDADTDAVVFEGTFGAPFYDHASDARVKQGDFSAFTQPGTYYIHVSSGELEADTEPFTIGEDVFDDLLCAALKMLTLQRCGTELDASLAGDFAHGACHTQPAILYGTDQTKDVSGGWHDAGDYGRYVVAGAKAVADLFLAEDAFGFDSDALGIPESGNGIPNVLDEARWELDWMLKMQDEKSGGVYHKVTGYAFPGVVMPQEETEQLVIAPISTAATGAFAAVMARASVLYRPYDAAFADRALDAALRAWDYLAVAYEEDTVGFVNPEDISTGEYPDRGLYDEAFWAAAELYLAVGDIEAQEDVSEENESDLIGASEFAQALKEIWEAKDLKPGLGWARITSYGMYDLLAAREEETGDIADLLVSIRVKLTAEVDGLLAATEKDGYFMTLGENYPWGSNMSVANNGIALLMADRFATSQDGTPYQAAARRQLNYLLGANALGTSFVTDFGSVSPQHPHHRPSQYVGTPVPGMLVGGPDGNLEDPYAKGVLNGLAPALCYVDNDQSYSTNEVAIYWNSPLICLLAGVTIGDGSSV